MDFGDFIIRRGDDNFAYQLAVVVDDALMGVTEIVRGRDLLTSTPCQIFIYEKLGFKAPEFYHLPLLLSTDGRRLSKRDRDIDMGFLRQNFSREEILGKILFLSGCLEKEEPIQVDEPTYSLDILPTVSNLFGMEYDSRLLVGRDVFAKNTIPLVLFRNYSWITDKGYYNALTQEFTPADESITVDEDYIKTISAIVKNKVKYSKYILEQNYYNILFK